MPIMKTARSRGFTLIELMIVVAIIGILAAIAIPKFADLIRKSNEGASKGNLGSMRGAMSIYYGDMAGQYPTHLNNLTENGKYLVKLPAAKSPNYHPDSTGHTYDLGSNSSRDTGRWGYDNVPNDANWGSLWISCTHTDTKGSLWSSY